MDSDNDTARNAGRVVVEHEGSAHIGATIVRAVGEATGIPTDRMGTALNDVIDPDALDQLFADRLNGTPRHGGRVVFTMLGCRVTLDGDGVVTVDPQPE